VLPSTERMLLVGRKVEGALDAAATAATPESASRSTICVLHIRHLLFFVTQNQKKLTTYLVCPYFEQRPSYGNDPGDK